MSCIYIHYRKLELSGPNDHTLSHSACMSDGFPPDGIIGAKESSHILIPTTPNPKGSRRRDLLMISQRRQLRFVRKKTGLPFLRACQTEWTFDHNWHQPEKLNRWEPTFCRNHFLTRSRGQFCNNFVASKLQRQWKSLLEKKPLRNWVFLYTSTLDIKAHTHLFIP